MNGLAISLFGKFDVRLDNHSLNGFDGAKVQELFCYLLLFRDRPHSREMLATLLWNDAAQSRKYLRKAVWQLQAGLDVDGSGQGKELLSIEPEWIELNLKTNSWLDAAVLESAFGGVQGIPAKNPTAPQYELLTGATALYRGDLLESCYADWCLLERERYRYMYLAILDKLMAYCQRHKQYDSGIAFGNLALAHDMARERTHRRLMRLFFLGGYRTEALRQYDRCVNALSRELDVAPTQDTRLLYEQIRAGNRPFKVMEEPSLLDAPLSLSAIQAQIHEAQRILTVAQLRIQQDLEAGRSRRA